MVVLGWEAGLAPALTQVEDRLRERSVPHTRVDLAGYFRWVELSEKAREVAGNGPPGTISFTGIRQWLGPGEPAARMLGEKLEADFDGLLGTGNRVLLWLTPHIWDSLRRLFPGLSERWVSFERIRPPDPDRLVAGVFEQCLAALVPMRHRGSPDRARRRYERFRHQMATFAPKVLTPEQLSWGVVLPWLRTLLDAGEYNRVVEEFRRWAVSIEPVAAAYGLSMLCKAGAEMVMGRTGGARSTLDEAQVRLKSAGHKKGEAIACSMKGQLEAVCGRSEEAELNLAMGTELGELAEARRLVAWNCVLLSILTLVRGHEEEAHNYLEYAWALLEAEGDVPGIATTLWSDTIRLGWFGNEREAREQMKRVWRILTILRDGTALTAYAKGLAYLMQKSCNEPLAREAIEWARSACNEIPFPEGVIALHSALEALPEPTPPG
jgi:hypothetical protein